MPFAQHMVALALLCVLGVPACRADSLASSASSAASQSVGSASTSIGHSSDSSTPNRRVAEGEYRVVETATAADRPGQLRLTLQAAANAGDEFYLYLPQATAERSGVGRGATVTARQREYGMEFSRADTGDAFFLALADDWFDELASNPVTL